MQKELTAEILKEHLHYDPETGAFTWIKKRRGRMQPGDAAGAINSHGYVKIHLLGKVFSAHRLAWLIYYGEWPPEDIDHIDRNKSNNRIDNLRKASRSMNSANVGIKSHNTSGYKGVSFNKEWGKWFAQIIVRGKKKFLGYYESPEKASEAYKSEARKAFGEYFPD
ncbi:HNH endonuclease [Cedecea neteri]|uniref:HNH endonuclease n=1 Tax=Cedecea neteri TaxID=158822 RepID=UPI002898E311|nr:HNH endonuclease [Cedecea neteri]